MGWVPSTTYIFCIECRKIIKLALESATELAQHDGHECVYTTAERILPKIVWRDGFPYMISGADLIANHNTSEWCWKIWHANGRHSGSPVLR